MPDAQHFHLIVTPPPSPWPRLLARRTCGPLVERIGPRMASFFEIDVAEEARRLLRRASTTGRPLGGAAWIKALEASTGRRLAQPPLGRPRAQLG